MQMTPAKHPASLGRARLAPTRHPFDMAFQDSNFYFARSSVVTSHTNVSVPSYIRSAQCHQKAMRPLTSSVKCHRPTRSWMCILFYFVFLFFLFPLPSSVSNIPNPFAAIACEKQTSALSMPGSPHIQQANLMSQWVESASLQTSYIFIFLLPPLSFFFKCTKGSRLPTPQRPAFNLRCEHEPTLRRSNSFPHLCFHLHIQCMPFSNSRSGGHAKGTS
jgi:hypothetical protein